jgi:hypothetical protein
METDVTVDLLQSHNNLNRNITMDTAVWYMSERFLGQLCERAWRARNSVVWESFEGSCVGETVRSTWVYKVDGEDIRSSGLVNGRLKMCRGAVVVCKWTDSPTWIVPTCVWKLSDCNNGSDCHKRPCWKNSIGVSVPRPCGSDVYVCSRSFRLCLTVVYWLLECNKVPSWIENPEYVTV